MTARFNTAHQFEAVYKHPAGGVKVTLVFKGGRWTFRGCPVDIYPHYRCEDCGEWTPPDANHYCRFSEET